MKRLLVISCIALAVLSAQPASAQVARPSDKAVSSLIESVQKSVKGFEKSLDSDLRKGTIRGATTEVNVQNYLNDFDAEIDRLRDRFKSKYSASSEVQGVLRTANGIERFVKSQPPTFKGRSEWDVAAASLNQLAGAYGATFPLPDGAAVRRINDAEIAEAADAVTKNASSYRKALKDAFTKEESAALTTAQKSVDALSTAAKNLKSRINSGKPASGEAGALAEAVTAAKATVAGRTLPEPAVTAWKGVEAAVAKVDQAFGVAKPAAESAPATAAQ